MLRHSLLALCLLGALAQAAEPLPRGVQVMPPDPAPGGPGRLIFSRDNNAPNACDVELYVNQQVVAKLGPGERTSLDLPSGELSVAVAISSAGYCGGRGPEQEQSVLLGSGETRQFAIMVEPGQVFLAPLLH
ncbi:MULTISPECIES: hypothetical protein [unclassified Pseudomonas]|uniref:hypothetical protein n=1 Tax=unclassified Pseudomonas TaxID=196821 RepID=UPI002449D00E|nr:MULTISPECIES: hypothetical protein [unclassified Pseudomonas]MDG9922854.1 DUF4397 domain-containing protein [Pseudomonas sp. GD04045]MDH0036865.1 DUF4397 domain-containing protein [Pseudomonas sp. GD04019]